jgi:hypothetical protein
MVDIIYLNVTCPYCGEISRMDCQTKQLFCNGCLYEVGDPLPEELNFILSVLAVGCCNSAECKAFEAEQGRANGRSVRVKVYVKEGLISSNYKIFTEFD